MRVMLLAPGFDVHAQRFLQWLQAAGCQVLFVDRVRPPNLDPSRSLFSVYPKGLPGAGNRLRRFDEWARYVQFHLLWRQFKPDVVHLHSVDGRQYDCFRAGLRPLVLTCWGSDIHKLFQPGADGVSRICTGRVLRHADHVFADSWDVLDRCDILAGCHVPSSLLYMGINTSLFRPDNLQARQAWRQCLAISEDAKVLLSVRACRRLYQHELILEAFAKARTRLSCESVLVFKRYFVDDPTYEEELRAQAKRLEVEKYLRWVERLPYEQMAELYAMADVVVNLPQLDGFPVSFIEAAACGTPVVTNLLPAYERIGLERFFRMVPDHSTEQLGRAIAEALMEQPESISAKARLARQWAVTSGDEKKCVEHLLTVYGRLAKRYNRGSARKGAASSCPRS